MSANPRQVLKDVFGHADFRGRQAEAVDAAMRGEDCVVLFPTGAGKSVCYQVPSLAREGTGIVISPLIALMEDQVAHLRQAGVRAETLNSTLDAGERRRVRADLLAGKVDVLYLSPERALTEDFLEMAGRLKVSLLAIDESHCVSSWGADFRREYSELPRLMDRLPGVPRMALTATADPRTLKDIRRMLGLEAAEVVSSSFDRPNISYSIAEQDDPKRQLRGFLKRHAGSSGIVYCLSRKKVEETAGWLRAEGLPAAFYHAGLPADERSRIQAAFKRDEVRILVATIAFGMGIDKPNVRFVAHMDIPSSVEAYYQETGRAGRDGEASEALMLYGMSDIVMRRRMIDDGNASAEVKRIERAKLNALLGIAETAGCRRKAILGHFGESHGGGCGNCDTCLSPVETFDGTEASRKLMSAVLRTNQRFGLGHVVDVLRGKVTDKARQFRHPDLSVFGIGKDMPEAFWKSVARQLVASGDLEVDHDAFGALRVTDEGRPLLRGERSVTMRRDSSAKGASVVASLKKAAETAQALSPEDAALFERLREVRSALAREQKVPPYVVFADATLRAMAAVRPRDQAEFGSLPGVGGTKALRYGRTFMDAVAEHEASAAPAPAP